MCPGDRTLYETIVLTLTLSGEMFCLKKTVGVTKRTRKHVGTE